MFTWSSAYRFRLPIWYALGGDHTGFAESSPIAITCFELLVIVGCILAVVLILGGIFSLIVAGSKNAKRSELDHFRFEATKDKI